MVLSSIKGEQYIVRSPEEAGKILGIEVLDLLIVNDKDDYYSMKEKGYM